MYGCAQKSVLAEAGNMAGVNDASAPLWMYSIYVR